MGTYGKTSLREKSWEVWLKKGDTNTSFFHEMTCKQKKKKRNSLAKVKINGVEIVQFFRISYWSQGSGKDMNFNALHVQDAENSNESFLEEEVFNTLKVIYVCKKVLPSIRFSTFKITSKQGLT